MIQCRKNEKDLQYVQHVYEGALFVSKNAHSTPKLRSPYPIEACYTLVCVFQQAKRTISSMFPRLPRNSPGQDITHTFIMLCTPPGFYKNCFFVSHLMNFVFFKPPRSLSFCVFLFFDTHETKSARTLCSVTCKHSCFLTLTPRFIGFHLSQ